MSVNSGQQIFDKLRGELNKVAKPAPLNVDKTFDASLKDGGLEKTRVAQGEHKTSVNAQTLQEASGPERASANAIPAQASPVKMAGARLSVGYLGEEMRENFIQNKGELSVSDKLGFNKTNQGGIDGASISVKENGDLVLNLDDNKAMASTSPISRASALEKNLGQNIEKLKTQWQQQANDSALPDAVRQLAQLAHDLAEKGQYALRITNGGGNSSATSIQGAEHLNVKPAGAPNYNYDRRPATSGEQKAASATATDQSAASHVDAATTRPTPPTSAPSAPAVDAAMKGAPAPTPPSATPLTAAPADARLVGAPPPTAPSSAHASTSTGTSAPPTPSLAVPSAASSLSSGFRR